MTSNGPTAYDRILDRLDGVRRNGDNNAIARCPAHDDRNPSLSLRAIENQTLVYCHAGCAVRDVLAAIEMTMGDLFNDPKGATYRYDDGRFVHRSPDKDFKQSGNTKGPTTLYRLANVTRVVQSGETILLVEGEKDVHALESIGVVATTAPMGARNFHKVDATPLYGAKVIAIADKDDQGQAWAGQVFAKLDGRAASLEFRQAKVGKDAAEHVAAGHGVDDLEELEIEAPADVVRGSNVYSRTDDGNALRFIDDYGHQFRRVADMRKWFVWDGCRWALDHEDRAVREVARELARELPDGSQEEKSFKRNSMSATGISGAVRVAETDSRVSIRAAELDAHPELLNTPTGVVNLRRGMVTPHDAGLLLTRITAHGVQIDAPHPGWDAFLAETFNGDAELIGYLQRIAGLALLGSVREHLLPFLYGSGANGKGVVTLVLQGLLGDADSGGYAVSAPDGFLMTGRDGKHETEIARLRGARLVVCAEQTSGKRFDESKVKRLTGGDVLTGRFMRGDFFDFIPSHLVWVLSNHLPAVREGGPSFWRRVRLIPFRNVVPEDQRVPDLHEQLLAAEGPAILGWAVRGAVEVLATGVAEPEAVVKATQDYEISEDTLASFVRDECLLGPNWWCPVGELRGRYIRHCEEMEAERLTAKALTMRLTTEYPVTSEKAAKGLRVYRGISLAALEDGEESAE
jgi:P4 family phage/plasmid primase-like protien